MVIYYKLYFHIIKEWICQIFKIMISWLGKHHNKTNNNEQLESTENETTPKRKGVSALTEGVHRKVSCVDQMAQLNSYYNVKGIGSQKDSDVFMEEVQRRKSVVNTLLLPMFVSSGFAANSASKVSDHVVRSISVIFFPVQSKASIRNIRGANRGFRKHVRLREISTDNLTLRKSLRNRIPKGKKNEFDYSKSNCSSLSLPIGWKSRVSTHSRVQTWKHSPSLVDVTSFRKITIDLGLDYFVIGGLSFYPSPVQRCFQRTSQSKTFLHRWLLPRIHLYHRYHT